MQRKNMAAEKPAADVINTKVMYGETSTGQRMILDTIIPNNVARPYGPVVDKVISSSSSIEDMLYDTCKIFISKDPNQLSVDDLPFSARFVLDYPSIGIEGNSPLNIFDIEVLDAVATLWQYNQGPISARAIYRIIVGKKNYQNIGVDKLDRIIKSLQKCSHATVKLNIEEFAERDSRIRELLEAHGVKKGHYNGPLIAYEYVDFNLNQKEGIKDYTINVIKGPLLYLYAKSIGKLSIFPIEIVEIEGMSRTMLNIMITAYLLRKIVSIYAEDRQPIIILDELYHAINKSEDSRQNKHKHRSSVELVLRDWTRRGLIRGFSTCTGTRGAILGYSIETIPDVRNSVYFNWLVEGPKLRQRVAGLPSATDDKQ